VIPKAEQMVNDRSKGNTSVHVAGGIQYTDT